MGKMAAGEGRCPKCRKPVKIQDGVVKTAKNGVDMLQGTCPHCSTRVSRFLGKSKKGGCGSDYTEPVSVAGVSGGKRRSRRSRKSKQSASAGGKKKSRKSSRKSKRSRK